MERDHGFRPAGLSADPFLALVALNDSTQVAVSESGGCELSAGDGVEEGEVGRIVEAQGTEAAGVLDDGAGNGVEEPGAGPKVDGA